MKWGSFLAVAIGALLMPACLYHAPITDPVLSSVVVIGLALGPLVAGMVAQMLGRTVLASHCMLMWIGDLFSMMARMVLVGIASIYPPHYVLFHDLAWRLFVVDAAGLAVLALIILLMPRSAATQADS